MKIINKKRHLKALKKELKFWKKPGIINSQKFRTERYNKYIETAETDLENRKIENILDIGSGPSCMAKYVNSGKKWYLDPLMDSFLELFPEQIPSGEHISENMEDYDFKENFFDIILSLNSFQDPSQVLLKIYKILKPGGIFLLSIYTRGAILAFLRNLQEYLHISTDIAHPYTFAREKMDDELNKAGFKINLIDLIEEEKDRKEFIWKCTKSNSA